MKARTLFRIASVWFVLFTAGHTFGFLNFKAPTPEAAAVRAAMDRTQFLGGHSFGGFYVGFGLYISLYLLFSAVLAWHLGDLAAKAPNAIGTMGWSFCGIQLASLALCCIYFGIPQAVFSTVEVVCLGWATWRARSGAAAISTSSSVGRHTA
jgi:hypothetical protein